MAWIGPRTTVEDRERVLGPGGVVPLGPPAPVGDLFALHAAAGIQLRVLPGIRAFFDGLVAGSMEFSGIRLRNADCRRT
jgi:uncharacterized protein DUF6886